MKGATNLGQRLSEAAKGQGAQELSSHKADDQEAWTKIIKALDPQQEGKLPETVNGQQAKHQDAQRKATAEVEAMAAPLIVLDTPASAAWASAAGIHSLSGQDTSLVAQGDLHATAAHTHASISGQTTSLYTHQGGIHIKAAAGPVSLQAHTDKLQIWADQEVQIISVNDEIRIQAQTKIELTAADSSIVLEGGDITFTTPGVFEAKHSGHHFLDGGSDSASLNAMPQGLLGEEPLEIELHYTYDDLTPVVGAAYKLTFDDGTVRQGTLDGNGYALLGGVPNKSYTVEYGEDSRPWQVPPDDDPVPDYKKGEVQAQGRAAIEKMLAAEPTLATPTLGSVA